MQPIYFLLLAMLAALSIAYATRTSLRPLAALPRPEKSNPKNRVKPKIGLKSFSNIKDNF